MNKLKEMLKTVSFKRWEVFSGLLLVLIIIVIRSAIFPFVSFQISKGKDALTKLNFLQTANTLDGKLISLENRVAKVDSLINISDNRDLFSEPVIIENIYTLAETAGCNISKVKIDEPAYLENGVEIPVVLKCSGNYESIGRFTDGIENINLATRIRQFNLKKIKNGDGEVTIEFVIMENHGDVINEG